MDWEIYERWEPDDAEDRSDADAESEVVPVAYGLAVGEAEVTTASHELDMWFTEWSIDLPERASERDGTTRSR